MLGLLKNAYVHISGNSAGTHSLETLISGPYKTGYYRDKLKPTYDIYIELKNSITLVNNNYDDMNDTSNNINKLIKEYRKTNDKNTYRILINEINKLIELES